MIARNGHAIGRLLHLHRGVTGEQFDQHAVVVGVEVLDQDESHPALGRQYVEQLSRCVEPARRCTDGDHWEAVPQCAANLRDQSCQVPFGSAANGEP